MCIRAFQRKRDNKDVGVCVGGGVCMCGERGRGFKELAYKNMEVAKSKIFRIGRRLKNQGKVDVAVQVCRPSAGRIPPSSREVILFLLSPSSDWMRSNHTIEGNLLYSESTHLNVNVIKKYLHRNIYSDV